MDRASQAPLTICPAGWSAYAAGALAPLASGEPGGLDHIRRQVSTGAWSLDQVEAAGSLAGVVVWRIEHDPDGARLVILYAAGGAPGVDLVADALPLIEARAKAAGCVRAAFWTERIGLLIKAQRLGYGEPKMMLEKVL